MYLLEDKTGDTEVETFLFVVGTTEKSSVNSIVIQTNKLNTMGNFWVEKVAKITASDTEQCIIK